MSVRLDDFLQRLASLNHTCTHTHAEMRVVVLVVGVVETGTHTQRGRDKERETKVTLRERVLACSLNPGIVRDNMSEGEETKRCHSSQN